MHLEGEQLERLAGWAFLGLRSVHMNELLKPPNSSRECGFSTISPTRGESWILGRLFTIFGWGILLTASIKGAGGGLKFGTGVVGLERHRVVSPFVFQADLENIPISLQASCSAWAGVARRATRSKRSSATTCVATAGSR